MWHAQGLCAKPRRKETIRKAEAQMGEWKDGTRVDLKEIGWGCVQWIKLALVDTVMNLEDLAPRSGYICTTLDGRLGIYACLSLTKYRTDSIGRSRNDSSRSAYGPRCHYH